MAGPRYQIGEVADRVGLSLRTVRYYEETGLIARRRSGLMRERDGLTRPQAEKACRRLREAEAGRVWPTSTVAARPTLGSVVASVRRQAVLGLGQGAREAFDFH
jgi:hypothetical protein